MATKNSRHALGADIVFGHRAGATFPHRAVHDGDELRLGNVTLRHCRTPGHTPESISIVVIDHAVSEEPHKVLTGDTLFIGDVGRPDLAGAKGYTAEQMAGMLYESLHRKLLLLADAVEVYPAHGAGSLCGRNISQERSSTIGAQQKFNYALQPIPKADFVRMMTTDLPEAPAYFPRDAEINRTGAAALAELPRPTALTPADVHTCVQRGVVVLDVRPAAAFGAGHIPGAMNIGLGGQFASWAGRLLALETPLVIVADDKAQVEEAVTRLARVGIEHVQGYLDGGMYAWHQVGLPVTTIAQIPVDELRHQLEEGQDVQVVDVRQPGEYASGHVPGAMSHTPLAHLAEHVTQLRPERPTAVICAGGYPFECRHRDTRPTWLQAPVQRCRRHECVGQCGVSRWNPYAPPANRT